MALIVDGTGEQRTTDDRIADDRSTTERGRQQRRIDVTDLHAAGIESFVRSNVDTDRVSLEHRGARTYLVLEK